MTCIWPASGRVLGCESVVGRLQRTNEFEVLRAEVRIKALLSTGKKEFIVARSTFAFISAEDIFPTLPMVEERTRDGEIL